MSGAGFRVGDAVRVRLAFPPGHIRTPYYCRGRAGRVERVCGDFPNPEERAVMRDGLPLLTLYRVRFDLRAIWPDYRGPAADTIEIELYENWLEPDLDNRAGGSRHAA